MVLCLMWAAASCQRQSQPTPAGSSTISVYFSPKGGCTEAIVAAVGEAQKTLDVQAYSFTSAPIAEAIVKAQERGVKVRVVLDKSQRTQQYTSATFLLNHKIPTFIDDKHAIAHNKVMVIDSSTLITGSFNFTKAAEEHNAENLLVIRGNGELAGQYEKNFEAHLAHSVPYTGPVHTAKPDPQPEGGE